MNSIINVANLWADQAWRFAWPMLWQSSLLLGVVFGVDWALRRKLRASVRYALWLVVLIKLVLPPSLALPSGVAWWLSKAAPVPTPPVRRAFVVTYGGARVLPVLPAQPAPIYIPIPPPQPSAAAWKLAGSMVVSFTLLGWMVYRWRRVAHQARDATPAPEWLGASLEEARRSAVLRHSVRVKLIDKPISPAVYGLFRPVILLPRALTEQLSPAQLRGVLLHELIHLQRGDIWVNCLQAMLQVVYWWHPLLWVANARIRRVREEAVDDAVMLGLGEAAEGYAPTLVEVAKLLLQRPMAALGLVGILESGRSLRRRIERLVDFRPPRKAGLSISSVLSILAFGAVAVPMGQAPAAMPSGKDKPELLLAQNQAGSVQRGSVQPPADKVPLLGDLPLVGHLFLSDSNLDSSRSTPIQSTRGERHTLSGKYPQPAPLQLRIYTLDTISLLQRYGNLGSNDVLRIDEANASWTNTLHGINASLRRLFTDAGVDLVPPKSCFYTCSEGALMVRATARDFDAIETVITKLELAPARFTTAAVTNSMALRSTNSLSVALTSSGKLFYEAAKMAEADAKLKEAIEIDPRNREAYNPNGTSESLSQPPQNPSARTNLIYTSKGRRAILSQLESTRLPQIQFTNSSLSEVVRSLSAETKKNDPAHRGINFLVNPNPAKAATPQIGIDPTTGLPVVPATSAEKPDISSVHIRVDPPINNARLIDVLDVVVKVADQPIKYSIEDYCVVFSWKIMEPQQLYMRIIKVDPNVFLQGLQDVTGTDLFAHGGGSGGIVALATTNDMRHVQTVVREFFTDLGVDLSPPKTIFFNDREGSLIIRGTLEDLDTVETAVQVLNIAPPQVNIKVSVLKVTDEAMASIRDLLPASFKSKSAPTAQDDPRALGFDWHIGNILTNPGSTKLLNQIHSISGVEVLNEASITTLSGRQIQIQIPDPRTNQAYAGLDSAQLTNSTALVSTSPSGVRSPVPILNVIPYVSADGRTIQLTTVTTVTGIPDAVQPVNNSVPLPHFRLREPTHSATCSAIIWDGQTVLLESPAMEDKTMNQNGQKQERYLFLITPTVVDPAGNRRHSDKEFEIAPR